ncbi:hypothetical protein BDN70DRAFT_940130 [Pholiota conissans]|uniref:C2H2-type domain-containing protein n=1 Tax=Pholiota conissans TaxID=109636 RepID=A0A9P5YK36_9AGAR|nr:hypothetical protein BDN70DRAFT_940130 [Pholiota conissans]
MHAATSPNPLTDTAPPNVLKNEDVNTIHSAMPSSPLFKLNSDAVKQVLADVSLHVVTVTSIPTPVSIIVCRECRMGVTQKNASTHPNNYHSIPISTKQKRLLEEAIQSLDVVSSNQELSYPLPNQPPIDGFKVYPGYSCNYCEFCCYSKATAEKHKSQVHRDIRKRAADTFKEASIQTFFIGNAHYFQVRPELEGLPSEDLYAVYVNTIAPELESLTNINGPVSQHELPLLLKETLWHQHLHDYVQDTKTTSTLVSLVKPPSALVPYGAVLARLINMYMHDIRQKAQKADVEVKYLLIECPRSVFFKSILRPST